MPGSPMDYYSRQLSPAQRRASTPTQRTQRMLPARQRNLRRLGSRPTMAELGHTSTTTFNRTPPAPAAAPDPGPVSGMEYQNGYLMREGDPTPGSFPYGGPAIAQPSNPNSKTMGAFEAQKYPRLFGHGERADIGGQMWADAMGRGYAPVNPQQPAQQPARLLNPEEFAQSLNLPAAPASTPAPRAPVGPMAPAPQAEINQAAQQSVMPAVAEKPFSPAVAEKPFSPAVAEKPVGGPNIPRTLPMADYKAFQDLVNAPVDLGLGNQSYAFNSAFSRAVPPNPTMEQVDAAYQLAGQADASAQQARQFVSGVQAQPTAPPDGTNPNTGPRYAYGFGAGQQGGQSRLDQILSRNGLASDMSPNGNMTPQQRLQLNSNQRAQLAVPQQPRHNFTVDGKPAPDVNPFGTTAEKMQRGMGEGTLPGGSQVVVGPSGRATVRGGSTYGPRELSNDFGILDRVDATDEEIARAEEQGRAHMLPRKRDYTGLHQRRSKNLNRMKDKLQSRRDAAAEAYREKMKSPQQKFRESLLSDAKAKEQEEKDAAYQDKRVSQYNTLLGTYLNMENPPSLEEAQRMAWAGTDQLYPPLSGTAPYPATPLDIGNNTKIPDSANRLTEGMTDPFEINETLRSHKFPEDVINKKTEEAMKNLSPKEREEAEERMKKSKMYRENPDLKKNYNPFPEVQVGGTKGKLGGKPPAHSGVAPGYWRGEY